MMLTRAARRQVSQTDFQYGLLARFPRDTNCCLPWEPTSLLIVLCGMSTGQQRKIYQSENGDSWWLCRERGTIFVLHEANLPSGGATTRIALPQFLSSSGNPPETQALLQMIGDLTQCTE